MQARNYLLAKISKQINIFPQLFSYCAISSVAQRQVCLQLGNNHLKDKHTKKPNTKKKNQEYKSGIRSLNWTVEDFCKFPAGCVLENWAISIQVLKKAWNFLASLMTNSFSRRTRSMEWVNKKYLFEMSYVARWYKKLVSMAKYHSHLEGV
jgi:hypothetical protein